MGGLKRTTYNGTTSGCPPPSQHHNYRRALHTQQRNHSERCNSGRFWKGVAQITRNRERAFTANLCSATLFPNSSICHPDRCAGNNCVGFPLLALRANTESCGQGHSSAAKMVLKTFNELRCGFDRDIGRSLIAAAQARSTDAPRIRRLATDRSSASGIRSASDAINHIFRAEKAISIYIGNTRCRCVALTSIKSCPATFLQPLGKNSANGKKRRRPLCQIRAAFATRAQQSVAATCHLQV